MLAHVLTCLVATVSSLAIACGASAHAHRLAGGGEIASLFRVDRTGRVVEERHGLDSAALTAFALSPTASFDEADAAVEALANATPAPWWRSYLYDGRHNWLRRDASDPALRTAPVVSRLDQYESFGDAAARYDADGALLAFADETYRYDSFGALVGARRGSQAREYLYDALGRLVREIDPRTRAETRYGYDGLRRVLRQRPDGRLDVTIEGDGLDEHLLDVDASSGRRLYYHQDRTHSVYLVTDDAGQPVETYSYTAFGEPTIRAASGVLRPTSAWGNRFGFQGQPFDAALGLVEMRARFYRPSWGRSLSPLTRAGIPQSSWTLIDATTTDAAAIEARLLRNGLTVEGTDVLRITGAGPTASSLR